MVVLTEKKQNSKKKNEFKLNDFTILINGEEIIIQTKWQESKYTNDELLKKLIGFINTNYLPTYLTEIFDGTKAFVRIFYQNELVYTQMDCIQLNTETEKIKLDLNPDPIIFERNKIKHYNEKKYDRVKFTKKNIKEDKLLDHIGYIKTKLKRYKKMLYDHSNVNLCRMIHYKNHNDNSLNFYIYFKRYVYIVTRYTKDCPRFIDYSMKTHIFSHQKLEKTIEFIKNEMKNTTYHFLGDFIDEPNYKKIMIYFSSIENKNTSISSKLTDKNSFHQRIHETRPLNYEDKNRNKPELLLGSYVGQTPLTKDNTKFYPQNHQINNSPNHFMKGDNKSSNSNFLPRKNQNSPREQTPLRTRNFSTFSKESKETPKQETLNYFNKVKPHMDHRINNNNTDQMNAIGNISQPLKETLKYFEEYKLNIDKGVKNNTYSVEPNAKNNKKSIKKIVYNNIYKYINGSKENNETQDQIRSLVKNEVIRCFKTNSNDNASLNTARVPNLPKLMEDPRSLYHKNINPMFSFQRQKHNDKYKEHQQLANLTESKFIPGFQDQKTPKEDKSKLFFNGKNHLSENSPMTYLMGNKEVEMDNFIENMQYVPQDIIQRPSDSIQQQFTPIQNSLLYSNPFSKRNKPNNDLNLGFTNNKNLDGLPIQTNIQNYHMNFDGSLAGINHKIVEVHNPNILQEIGLHNNQYLPNINNYHRNIENNSEIIGLSGNPGNENMSDNSFISSDKSI